MSKYADETSASSKNETKNSTHQKTKTSFNFEETKASKFDDSLNEEEDSIEENEESGIVKDASGNNTEIDTSNQWWTNVDFAEISLPEAFDKILPFNSDEEIQTYFRLDPENNKLKLAKFIKTKILASDTPNKVSWNVIILLLPKCNSFFVF